MSYFVNPDISKANTLPGSYYQDEEIFNESKDKIFAKSWQYIGDKEDIKSPGMVCPKQMLPGHLDESILLTRDLNDETLCLSNVCTHRANLVVRQPGIMRNLRCRYHGRKFALDGKFDTMPEFDNVVDFPSEKDNLRKLPLKTLSNVLYFTSVSPEISFDKYIAPVIKRIEFLPLDKLKYDHSRSRDYLVDAHWALYVDNYLEGFHIPYVHPSLNEEIDYGQYVTEIFDHGNLQIGISEGGEVTFDLPRNHPDVGKEIAAYYFWLWPNIMLNFYPWGLSLNLVQPLTINRTKITFRTYILDSGLIDKGAGSGLDRVEREDEIVVENVAKGVKSRLYTSGRFSPTMEKGVHQFHRMLADYQ